MKNKFIIVFLISFVLSALTACSDIEYPPAPVFPLSTSEGVSFHEDDPSRDKAIPDKYTAKKFDLTVKPFLFERETTFSSGELTLSVDFNSSQHYRIEIITDNAPVSGVAVISLSSGGETFGAFYVSSSENQDENPDIQPEYFMYPIYFPEGRAELTFTFLRGSVTVERIVITEDSPIPSVRFTEPVQRQNHGAPSSEAGMVFAYLRSQFGDKVISAQHCTAGTNAEIEAVFAASGREPAVRFSDLPWNPDNPDDFDLLEREIELAEGWWSSGGIVGFAWTPEYYDSDEDFIEKADFAAGALERLLMADVPVLFNPLPDGGSRLHRYGETEEEYVRLWNLLYDRLVNYHGLNNLIWIWSGGSYTYFPGSHRVDIIGESVFSQGEIGSQAVRLAYSGDYNNDGVSKTAAVIAASGLPSPDFFGRDKSMWLMWTLYKGDFVIDSSGRVRDEMKEPLERFYNHELVVSRDELPDFV